MSISGSHQVCCGRGSCRGSFSQAVIQGCRFFPARGSPIFVGDTSSPLLMFPSKKGGAHGHNTLRLVSLHAFAYLLDESGRRSRACLTQPSVLSRLGAGSPAECAFWTASAAPAPLRGEACHLPALPVTVESLPDSAHSAPSKAW